MVRRPSAVVAGLALSLAFGSAVAPQPAVADDATPGVASDATDIDKGLFTEQSFAGAMRSVQGISLVNVSDEMKYFTKYESHGNYSQGFSYGDGYNALGYYQFDRRWSLIPFMRQVYNYNPAKYGMLKDAIDRGNEIADSSNAMFANGQLTELGRIAQDTFQGAYAADPVEFAALQDSYAYNSYYAVTESWLRSALGIDITGRADCVKGMVWSITNMCGTGGCQDFLRWANLSNGMSDREFVTALANSVVNNVARKYPNQSQYHAGWQNRYRNELKDCLVYISEDEATAATKPSESLGDSDASAGTESGTDSGASSGDSSSDSGSDGAASDGGAASGSDANEGASGSNGSAADDSSSNSKESSGSDVGSTDSGDSSSKGDASNSGNAPDNGSSDNASEMGSTGDSDTKADDKDGNDASEKDPVDEGSNDFDGKDDDKTEGKIDDGKSEGEKLGEAVGQALTSGLSKGEGTADSQGKDKGKSNSNSGVNQNATNNVQGDSADSNGRSTTGDNKQSNSKTTTDNMPRTGDLVIMASLASASLASFGMTAIVSGKNRLKDQGMNDDVSNFGVKQ